ncbi:MAG: M23 family metallopeptidase [Candidatus Latescibacterota bacterium]|jgi:murein DD-endopeptidase MepM/ murein hydrolase activator NlpD
MPKQRVTFIVIPGTEGHVREFKCSRWVLSGLAVMALMVVGALGFYARGYYTKTDQHRDLARMSAENQDLMRGLNLTKKNLENLQSTMETLVADDERLRAYHMMEPLSSDERMGGMGGSDELPEAYVSLPAEKLDLLEGLNARIVRLQQEATAQERSFEEIRRKYLETEGNLRHFPTISPVPLDRTWISSRFGARTDPFTGRRAFHSGLDFAGRTGTPVYATADGVVSMAYMDSRLGRAVVIDHDVQETDEGGGTFTRKGVYRTEYGHLDRMLVQAGERVKRGQQIGALGNSGRSTGPHLHYAVRYQDRGFGDLRGYKGYVNPADFVLDGMPPNLQVASAGGSAAPE